MTAVLVSTIGIAGLLGIAADDKPTEKSTLLGVSSATYTPPDTCVDSQRAITYYRRAYAATRERMRAAGPVPRVWYRDCDVVRRRAAEWRDKAADARVKLGEWVAYHFHWWDWLPANWYVVGRCETGYGGPPNWRHANSRFVSGFGISRREYDRDAAYMGAPPWNDARPPTPREQYLAAVGHYRRFGDGWTCPGP